MMRMYISIYGRQYLHAEIILKIGFHLRDFLRIEDQVNSLGVRTKFHAVEPQFSCLQRRILRTCVIFCVEIRSCNYVFGGYFGN